MTLESQETSDIGMAGVHGDTARFAAVQRPLSSALFATEAPTPEEITAARRHAAARKARMGIFPDGLFGEPAWDMLLDLFIAQGEGKRVSISSACIAAAVPQSTALRCMGILLRHGLVARTADAEDRRRTFLSITPEACAHMRAWIGLAKPR